MTTAANPRDFPRTPLTGALLGLACGVVAGAIWWIVVVSTGSKQSYLIAAFGVAVAFGVSVGAHEPGRRSALIAVGVTMLTLVLSFYFVERYLVVKWFADNDDSISIPVVPYLDWVVVVVRHAISSSPAFGAYALLALVAAAWFGYHGFGEHDHHRRN